MLMGQTYNRRKTPGILALFGTLPAGQRRAKFTMPRKAGPKARIRASDKLPK